VETTAFEAVVVALVLTTPEGEFEESVRLPPTLMESVAAVPRAIVPVLAGKALVSVLPVTAVVTVAPLPSVMVGKTLPMPPLPVVRGRRISPPALTIFRRRLFYFSLGTSFGQLLGNVFSFSFGYGFFNGLRSAVNQVLGFFQAQTGDSTYNLDHVNLVVASGGQDYVELGLLFSGSSASSRTSNCNCSSGT